MACVEAVCGVVLLPEDRTPRVLTATAAGSGQCTAHETHHRCGRITHKKVMGRLWFKQMLGTYSNKCVDIEVATHVDDSFVVTCEIALT